LRQQSPKRKRAFDSGSEDLVVWQGGGAAPSLARRAHFNPRRRADTHPLCPGGMEPGL